MKLREVLDGPTILLILIIAVLSVVFAFGAHQIADHYSVRTLGALAADRLVHPSLEEGIALGNRILVEIAVDVAFWFAILSGLIWVISKLRS